MATEYLIAPDGTLIQRTISDQNLGNFAEIVNRNLTQLPVFIQNALEIDSVVTNANGETIPARIPVSLLSQKNGAQWIAFIPKDSILFSLRLHLFDGGEIFGIRDHVDLRPGAEIVPGSIKPSTRWKVPFENQITFYNAVEIDVKRDAFGREVYSCTGSNFRMAGLIYVHATRRFLAPFLPNIHDNSVCCTGNMPPDIAAKPTRNTIQEAVQAMHNWFEDNRSNDHLTDDRTYPLFRARLDEKGRLHWVPPYDSAASAAKAGYAALGRETGLSFLSTFAGATGRALPPMNWDMIRKEAAALKKS